MDGAPTLAELLISVSTHGAPVDALLAAGADRSELDDFLCPGPAGRPWAAMDGERASWVVGHTTRADYQDACATLHEAWDPNGWDYLRRAPLAVQSGRAELMLRDHVGVLHGSLAVAREHLLDRYEALARSSDPIVEPFRIASLLGAARLAERRQNDGDFDASVAYLSEALSLESRPGARGALLYELANRHALHRTAASLARARTIYARAFAILPEIADDEQRVRSEITFLNGLALVEYLQHRGEEAMALERRALELAEGCHDRWPAVADWARPLLHTNTAKLMDRRFGNRGAAIEHLHKAVLLAREEHREHLTVELARMYFDTGHNGHVVDLLEPFFADAGHISTDEREEMLARALLVVAYIRLGQPDRAAAQQGRLRTLSAVTRDGTPSQFQQQLEALLAPWRSAPPAAVSQSDCSNDCAAVP